MKSSMLFLLLLVGGITSVQGQQQFVFPSEYPTQIIDPDIAWRRADAEGYTKSPSIARGHTAEFKVSTRAAWDSTTNETTHVNCSLQIYRVQSEYRLGSDSCNDPRVYGPVTFQATFHPLRSFNNQLLFPKEAQGARRYPRDYRSGCYWATDISVSGTITSSWASGLYYAKITPPAGYAAGYIPFVVRPADQEQNRAAILCVVA